MNRPISPDFKSYLIMIWVFVIFSWSTASSLVQFSNINAQSTDTSQANKDEVNGLANKGFQQYVLENYTGAIEYFDKALAIDPSDTFALLNRYFSVCSK